MNNTLKNLAVNILDRSTNLLPPIKNNPEISRPASISIPFLTSNSFRFSQQARSYEEPERSALSSPILFRRSSQYKKSGSLGRNEDSSFSSEKYSGRMRQSKTFCVTDDSRFRRDEAIRKPVQMLRLRKQQTDYNGNLDKVSDTISPAYDTCNECEILRIEDPTRSKSTENIQDVFGSPSPSPDGYRLEGETEEDAEMRRSALKSSRRRSSTVVHIPSSSIHMDLHTLYLEGICAKSMQKKGKSLEDPRRKLNRGIAVSTEEDSEKKAGKLRSMLRHKFKRDESSTLDDFKDFLEHARSNLVEIFEHDLAKYKNSHWSTISEDTAEPHNGVEEEMIERAKISGQERERYEALWELFYAEVSYLLDHLLILRDVFAKPLEHAKNFGFLLIVNETILFANLDQLIQVISDFAEKLLKIFKSCGVSVSKSTEIIVEAFKEFDDILTPQYNEYCLNYQKAKDLISWLKNDEIFTEFIKWGEADERCQRRQLDDLLVAPLQHLTKYPLLLKAIRKHTPKDDINNQLLTTTIIDIERSIKSIEKKISSLINLQRLQELHLCVKWPVMPDTTQKCAIPDFVRADLSNNQCDTILMNPNRILIQEGQLTLADNNKSEYYVFLFDDMLLVTKVRKRTKRRANTLPDNRAILMETETIKKKHSLKDMKDTQFIVHKQPIPLDRLKLYDCDDQPTGFKNAFCVLHFNRYHQTVSIYTFQAQTETDKTKWIKNLTKAKESVIAEAYSSSNKEVSSDEEYML